MAAQREAQQQRHDDYITERVSVQAIVKWGGQLVSVSTLPRQTGILDQPLAEAPIGDGKTTGFFRNNFCDASPLDPGSHTVAAVVNKDFLDYSASVGNDLRSLFPSIYSTSASASSSTDAKPCVWCLCASRWAQALRASTSHPLGSKIVPSVILEATHRNALKDGGIEKEELLKWKWNGASGGGNGGAAGGKKEKEIIGR
ncbi:hypothetical protein JCM16303_007104 [Sporobolomyces ruberrimus]